MAVTGIEPGSNRLENCIYISALRDREASRFRTHPVRLVIYERTPCA